jgi:hypothetical protein
MKAETKRRIWAWAKRGAIWIARGAIHLCQSALGWLDRRLMEQEEKNKCRNHNTNARLKYGSQTGTLEDQDYPSEKHLRFTPRDSWRYAKSSESSMRSHSGSRRLGLNLAGECASRRMQQRNFFRRRMRESREYAEDIRMAGETVSFTEQLQ